MRNPSDVKPVKSVTIAGRVIPGNVIASVRERMKIRHFREGEVITWMKEAGLQGLAAVSLHQEFIRREIRAGRLREENGLLVAAAPARAAEPEDNDASGRCLGP